jgi:hypothetical protein
MTSVSNNGSGNPLAGIDFDNLTPAQFENYLPEFFAEGQGSVSNDPRLQKFLHSNPDCAALVRDLETIAETARSLFEPVEDPSDSVWSNIQSKLLEEPELAPELDTGLANGIS